MNAATFMTMFLVVTATSAARAGEVTIAVASNFATTARAVAASFERTSGHRVTVTTGSTGMLYSQAAHGAPYDILLAADRERPARAEETGLAVAGTRFTYAVGRLVLWSPRADTFTDGEAYVRGLAFSRLAIANPRIAPYGLAAQQVLERLGVWERAQSRLVRGENVAQTFQFAATGNADAGLVALSQVPSASGGAVWEVPAGYHPPIEQQAVLLKHGERNAAAVAFVEYLKSPAAHRIIASHGYRTEPE